MSAPHAWTDADIRAAIAMGVFAGVAGTLGLELLCKGVVFPLIDWVIAKLRAERKP